MLVSEAQWIAEQLRRLPDDVLFPLLNVGSSTGEFRSRVQPHIDELVFAPLRDRGGQVWHADLKPGGGVDIVGDFAEPALRARLRELGVRSAMVSNLLEHVVDRPAIAAAVLDIVPSGGHVIVTGPYRFPHHADPIDTLYRPEIAEVAELFGGTDIVADGIIDAGNWRQWDPSERAGRTATQTLIRAMVPFKAPAQWRATIRHVPYLLRHAKAFGVVLRKR